MAKLITKDMTPAELKNLKKELTTSLAALNGSVKLSAKERQAAEKADALARAAAVKFLANAQKEYDVAAKVAEKALSAAQKGYESQVKASEKVLATFIKASDAAGVKLGLQISAHEVKIEQVAASLTAPAVAAAKEDAPA